MMPIETKTYPAESNGVRFLRTYTRISQVNWLILH